MAYALQAIHALEEVLYRYVLLGHIQVRALQYVVNALQEALMDLQARPLRHHA